METYIKVTKEDGTTEFVKVEQPVAQETKPAEQKPESKSFGQVMSEVWKWLAPRIQGAGVMAAITLVLGWLNGRDGGDIPQIPGTGGSDNGPSIM